MKNYSELTGKEKIELWVQQYSDDQVTLRECAIKILEEASYDVSPDEIEQILEKHIYNEVIKVFESVAHRINEDHINVGEEKEKLKKIKIVSNETEDEYFKVLGKLQSFGFYNFYKHINKGKT